MPGKLSPGLLSIYVHDFFGVGTWKAPLWFVGMEEGGGREFPELDRRLRRYRAHTQDGLADALEFYPAFGVKGWHGPAAKPQATWQQLIRILLTARGEPDTPEAILDYQRSRLGTRGGETCLIELLPLPSPDTNTWLYPTWSKLPWLQTRDTYFKALHLERICAIKEKVAAHKPRVVLFYGASWHRHWGMIAGGSWQQAIPDKLMIFKSKETTFLVSRHPVVESDDYFREIGMFIRNSGLL